MTITPFPVSVTRSPRAIDVRRALKAEWTKLRTLPSTWRSVGAALVVSLGLGTALVFSQVSSWKTMSLKQHADFDPTSASMIGVLFAAVILGAMAVRSVTSEYSSGMIRTTFTARPARQAVLAAKAATAAALTFPVALVCNFAGFEIGQRILAAKHVNVSLGHSGVIAAIVLGAVAISLVSVIGVGLGALIRRTAPATTALTLVFIGGALFAQFAPTGLRQYLPETATQAVVTVHRSAGLLRPGPALALLACYAVIALGAAAMRIGRRDA
jgi:ABC-type transport system involved in multi-copper enzyme maturation permease subunit